METIQRNTGNSNMLVLTRDLVGEKKQQKTKEREMISKPDRDVSNILWLEKLFYSDLAKTNI